ncbi:His Kinase A (phospho-acceptor) domain-containing protein [Actinomadura meyerae]|uniref:Sensor-like histidine kinase SenX3 n=1 Tax=Actinomadura meyerae TaxID=240840 RepID=A0A239N766_9ACTN|nr:HAMP domain-containing sensor histidine kinase [Actinomadura meyerae]SNT50028.1 His Kinase A (phospho-acceptor) domain-containing protein [Actinomadura meyerae]
MIPFEDLLWVAWYSVLAACTVAAAALAVLYALRDRSVATQLVVVGVATVLATISGIIVISFMMVLNDHDRSVVLAVVAAAGVVAMAVSVLLGRRLVAANRTLVEAVRADRFRPPAARLPAELAELSRELEAAYDRLAASHEREQALEASRRELVAWVSHDLRTPLAGLRAMAEALEDEVVADAHTVHRYHGRIRVEVERLAEMVDDLFELSRIHAGALRLSRERVGLADLVAEAVAGTEALARAKGVRLRGDAREGLPVQVDAGELGRALRNLVVNAIRHTPSDGAVEIIGEVADGEARVTVADACGGIPEDDLPRVFDVAFRGEAARTPGGGAGLGLAIARGIVEAHAGHIGVANDGPGCRFEVRLPLTAVSP